MNASERKAAAELIRAALAAHGAAVEVEKPDRNGFGQWEIAVRATFPGVVSVNIDVSSIHDGGALASWYGAAQRLNPRVFPGVNEFHGRKATSYCGSFASMAAHMRGIGAAIQSGRAFA